MAPRQPTLETVADPMNLLAAYRRARRGKRTQPDASSFELSLEEEIFTLRDELLGGLWRPGPYRQFTVYDPVKRRISAAPFRDRVVHQALCHELEPLLEAELLPCSFACRRGMGSHRALRVASYWAKRKQFVLHADVRKFFASIDHQILGSMLADRLQDKGIASLCDAIIDHSNPQEIVLGYYPGDTLFTPVERRCGLPIGNLTSQWFGNLMLHPVDAWIAIEAGETSYVRYMDDMLVFGDSTAQLVDCQNELAEVLAKQRLRLNAQKTRIHHIKHGFAFLGFRIFPTHRRLLGRSARRAWRRLRRLRARERQGQIDFVTFHRSLLAWVAHARHGDTYRLRVKVFRELGLSREVGLGP